ncbi:hypothetical protein ACHAWO_006618 [Cyclotella atomus]|uniref:Uncharacterized protein n=1 Tax=Cyclotella atomus TaxID=382360 RepID=A0ABD3P653_9STRA
MLDLPMRISTTAPDGTPYCTLLSYKFQRLIYRPDQFFIKCNRSDVTVRFVDENNKELGRDYFVAPLGQCTVTGYGNIKTITPRGGNNVYMVASCDLCGKVNGPSSLTSAQMATNGQVTDCF